MYRRFLLALLVAATAALSIVPAFAQGPVNDQFCAGGTTVVEPGTTVRNLALFGCSGVVRAGGTVDRDAVVFGGSLTIEQGARVNRTVAIVGGSVLIDGEVGSDVAIAGGSVNLSDTAVVGGNIRIAGGSLQRSPGATVRGSISQENNPRGVIPTFSPFVGTAPVQFFQGGLDFLRSILVALATAVLGVLVVVLFPVPTQRVAATAQGATAPSFGVGCLTLVITPIFLIALAITIIGIPLVLLLALAAAAAWYFGWITIGYIAGLRVLEALKVREITPVLAVIVGVLVIAFIGVVPVIGGLVNILVGTLGVGAVLLTRFGTRAYPSWPASGALDTGPSVGTPPAPGSGLVSTAPTTPTGIVATPPSAPATGSTGGDTPPTQESTGQADRPMLAAPPPEPPAANPPTGA